MVVMKKIVFTDEGNIDKYRCVNIKKIADKSFEMTQLVLIERITAVLGINNEQTHARCQRYSYRETFIEQGSERRQKEVWMAILFYNWNARIFDR